MQTARTKAKTIKLPEEVRAALEAATISNTNGRGFALKLVGQLDRDTYVKTDKVIKAAGGKWNRGAAAHLFERDPREVLGLAVSTGAIVDKKKTLGQFFTPAPLARSIVMLSGITRHERVLEPSAGSGTLADAVRELTMADPLCVEIDPDMCAHLRAKGHNVIEGDFLSGVVDGALSQDVVIMNPPFLGNEGIRHILHAYSLLVPGGRLFAIAPKGAETGSTALHSKLGGLIMSSAGRRCGQLMGGVVDLEEGSFEESGTKVRTVLIKLSKPVL